MVAEIIGEEVPDHAGKSEGSSRWEGEVSEVSNIEWTHETWNPIVGCSLASPGCTNCYAMTMAKRLQAMGVAHYAGLTKTVNGKAVWTGTMALAPDRIVNAPLFIRKPKMFFVNSMSDLFHEDVPDEWIDRVFAIMAKSYQHTFQVLTKRAKRMREYALKRASVGVAAGVVLTFDDGRTLYSWPLPNVWLGVSCEDQRRADERIPDLLATPAAIRFVSAEPLLGPIDFTMIDSDGVTGLHTLERGPVGIDWVIVGGESGSGARPFDLRWARDIVRQCKDAGVACFVKQMGAHPHDSDRPGLEADGSHLRLRTKAKKGNDPAEWPEELRVRQMPEATAA